MNHLPNYLLLPIKFLISQFSKNNTEHKYMKSPSEINTIVNESLTELSSVTDQVFNSTISKY